VPANFLENLTDGYRDYLDVDGTRVREGREGSFHAFVYFLDRMLPSVNTTVNKYGGPQRKTVGFGNVFTVNDEAFALVMMENYVERWTRLAKNRRRHEGRQSMERLEGTQGDVVDGGEDGEDGTSMRHNRFRARYTSSNEGMSTSSGWSMEGIRRFNEFASDVGQKRKVKQTGKGLEDYMIRYWQGTTGEQTQNMKDRMGLVMAHCEDDSLFVGDMKFV